MQVHACTCTFNACKITKMACAHALLHAILACAREIHSKHKRDTRDAHYELALGLPHYMCDVTTGTVAVGNKIQLLCS